MERLRGQIACQSRDGRTPLFPRRHAAILSPRAGKYSPVELGAERGPVETEQLGRGGAVAAGGSDDLLHERGFDEIDERFVEWAGTSPKVSSNIDAKAFDRLCKLRAIGL